MRLTLIIVASLLVMPAVSLAQPAPEAIFGSSTNSYISSANVQAAITKAKAEHKSDNSNTLVPIITIGPYVMNVEYRTGRTAPTIHNGLSEFIYVLAGSATFYSGGKLVGGKGVPELVVGKSISGKPMMRNISKGDFIVVPSGTPHQFLPTTKPFVIVSTHIPTPPSK